MNYNKTWEVMNDLEESFNKISSIEFLISELQEAVDKGDTNHINDVTAALSAFMPVYIENYDRASKRAWNNTVNEVAKIDNPYKSSKESNFSYDDVLEYLKTDPYENYVSRPQKEKTES